MNTELTDRFRSLFADHFGQQVIRILPLPPSGSRREYYRLEGSNHVVMGAYNPDPRENEAFVTFTRHFREKGVPVPEVYATDLDNDLYLVEDLGDTTLFSYLSECRKAGHFPMPVYKRVVEELAHLQIVGSQGLDYSVCYPREQFDRQSMLWDMSYFKHFFLKVGNLPYDEQALEDDFNAFAGYLMSAGTDYFLFRDFQSRNIMLHDGGPHFIDYQGGRRGALQYDVASLLWQAKAALTHAQRQELLDHYLAAASKLTDIDAKTFVEMYYGYVLVRTIQVLGAYGFRGFYERKDHFLDSIPFAAENAKWLLDNAWPPVALPALRSAMEAIVSDERFQHKAPVTYTDADKLTVRVRSFSYKHDIPEDPGGHGGGFVFDCRAIHNPGRYEPYKRLTGRDDEVKLFLQKYSDIDGFLRRAYSMVDESVETYLERGFDSLMIAFGCTGGQHRSVYAADKMTEHLRSKYGVTVDLLHVEQERKGWKN
ncbi:MAG: RNase adapter RapZ [Bacteroidota bacterium]